MAKRYAKKISAVGVKHLRKASHKRSRKGAARKTVVKA
jgi:hypothetical protein